MSWKDYLYYSKKERRGIAVLLVLIFFMMFLPSLVQSLQPEREKVDYTEQIEKIKANGTPLEKPNYNNYQRKQSNSPNNNQYKTEIIESNTKHKNSSSKDKQHTRDNSKQNTNPTQQKDLAKIKDYVAKNKIATNPKDNTRELNVTDKNEPVNYNKTQNKNYQKFEKTFKDSKIIIDINTATAKDFTKLKGIGEKLSTRIITFRTKLGGFYNIEQLADTYGIEPEVFNGFKHQLQCNSKLVKKHNFNTESIEQLSAHSYISPKLAEQIVNFREKVKPYESYEDVQKLYYFKNQPELYKKLKPYIAF